MLTVQIESFAAAMPELVKIFPTHWEELALFKDRMPLAPQYEEYIAREMNGDLFLATVRWDGKIAGYYTAQCRPGFHYKETFTALQDMVYIVPEYRDLGLSLPLFRLVERELRRRGVQLWYAGYKTDKSLRLPELLSRIGFMPADTYMAKWIGQ